MTYIRSYVSKREKMWFWLSGMIVLLLGVYIVTLNFAVSESFRRGEIERESKILRQDLQKSEEVFIANLSQFYDQYSGNFSQAEISKQEFVTRQENFAVGGRNFR